MTGIVYRHENCLPLPCFLTSPIELPHTPGRRHVYAALLHRTLPWSLRRQLPCFLYGRGVNMAEPTIFNDVVRKYGGGMGQQFFVMYFVIVTSQHDRLLPLTELKMHPCSATCHWPWERMLVCLR